MKALFLDASAHQLQDAIVFKGEGLHLVSDCEMGAKSLMICTGSWPCLHHIFCAAQDTSSAMHMLRSERRVLPVLPAPAVTEQAADPAPMQHLQDAQKTLSPAVAPVLTLDGQAHGGEEALQRPEASAGAVESSGSEAEDAAAAQVTHCTCRSGLSHQPDIQIGGADLALMYCVEST